MGCDFVCVYKPLGSDGSLSAFYLFILLQVEDHKRKSCRDAAALASIWGNNKFKNAIKKNYTPLKFYDSAGCLHFFH